MAHGAMVSRPATRSRIILAVCIIAPTWHENSTYELSTSRPIPHLSNNGGTHPNRPLILLSGVTTCGIVLDPQFSVRSYSEFLVFHISITPWHHSLPQLSYYIPYPRFVYKLEDCILISVAFHFVCIVWGEVRKTYWPCVAKEKEA
jgi:hypothetical protein